MKSSREYLGNTAYRDNHQSVGIHEGLHYRLLSAGSCLPKPCLILEQATISLHALQYLMDNATLQIQPTTKVLLFTDAASRIMAT